PPACSPGVSTKTIWASGRLRMPVIRLRVVWGRGETMASFWPTSRFRSVDLPALGRPMRDTKPAFTVVAGPARPARAVGGATTLSTDGPAPRAGSRARGDASGRPPPGRGRRSPRGEAYRA